jgi:hypothetical protein
MNPAGKTAGGGKGGGKCKSGKRQSLDSQVATYALTTAKEHVLKLRKCLQTDEGFDKVSEQGFSPSLHWFPAKPDAS